MLGALQKSAQQVRELGSGVRSENEARSKFMEVTARVGSSLKSLFKAQHENSFLQVRFQAPALTLWQFALFQVYLE